MQFSETARSQLVFTAVSDMIAILSDLEAREAIGKEEAENARRAATTATLDADPDAVRAFWLIYASLVVRSQGQRAAGFAQGWSRRIFSSLRSWVRSGQFADRLAAAAITLLLVFVAVSLVVQNKTSPTGTELATVEAPPVVVETPVAPAPVRVPYMTGYGLDHPNFAALAPIQLHAQYDPPQMAMQ